MSRARYALCFFTGLIMSAGAAGAAATHTLLGFDDLNGWQDDNHSAALSVFMETCPDLKDPVWHSLCALGGQQSDAKAFFELFFLPVLVQDTSDPLFTGYYEPELRGSRVKTEIFKYPLYQQPPEVRSGTPWLTRRQIEEGDTLNDRDLELVWVDDPVDLFFLQVQGSGRVRLADGGKMRVGFGGKNGHEYKSIGQEMVRRGIYEPHQVSAQVIKNWVRRNPVDGAELLRHNPSYVFFREASEVPADKGPLGAMNRSVTTLRTLAVDPAFTPLGAPVWMEKEGETPMRRLMIAQDTGSAIKGAQRADIFFGTGGSAGRAAGQIRDPGRLITLLPTQKALALVPEGRE